MRRFLQLFICSPKNFNFRSYMQYFSVLVTACLFVWKHSMQFLLLAMSNLPQQHQRSNYVRAVIDAGNHRGLHNPCTQSPGYVEKSKFFLILSNFFRDKRHQPS